MCIRDRLLRDVDYLIHARFELTEKADPKDTVAKYAGMFRRRAENGQCFNQPYLGCREFSAAFSAIDFKEPLPEPITDSRDLGWMLYDLEYHGTEPVSYTHLPPVSTLSRIGNLGGPQLVWIQAGKVHSGRQGTRLQGTGKCRTCAMDTGRRHQRLL